MVLLSECSKRMFLSLALIRNLSLIFTLGRSLMHDRKKVHRIDPCGTLHSIPKKDDAVSFIDAN